MLGLEHLIRPSSPSAQYFRSGLAVERCGKPDRSSNLIIEEFQCTSDLPYVNYIKGLGSFSMDKYGCSNDRSQYDPSTYR